tara:strand:+ start:945 stop:2564 length:1620 start_codon:yes stop_codon:yes gene_type:complete
MSGTVIVTKYSTGTGSPATNALAVGEQAYSFSSDKLFIGETSGSDVVARIIGGQLYTDMMDHAAGTLTASSAIIVDANSKIDVMNVGNITVTGSTNTISSTNTNGDIVITPHGSGEVIIDGLVHPQADGTAGQFLKTDGSGNLDFATVVSSFTIAAESGTADTVNTGETLTFAAGEGINTVVSANTITITGEEASSSNKGVASFDATNLTVSSGVVTLNSDLNSLTSVDVDNITIDGNVISTTNTNGNLDLTPNGTGTVTVPSNYAGRAGFTSDSLVNKTYVDSVANGLDVKASVRVVTTANLGATYSNSAGTLTNSGTQAAIAIDGVTLIAQDRVLVKDQTTQAQNGFYKVTTIGSGSANWVLTRTPDADAASELTAGAFTFAEEGTLNGDNGYVMSTNGAVTLGTTAITFEQFSGAGQITAGNGLTKNGNTIDAVGTSNRISVTADTLDIASTYVGQTSITTLGTIGTGTWAATDVAVAHGGTGLSSFTADSVIISNSAGTALGFIDVSGAQSQYNLMGFNSSGVPVATTTIDGGTF